MLAADVGDAGAFGPEHPLVAVGGQKVDRRLAHVERKRAEALDRVEQQQGPALRARSRRSARVVPIAGGVADPAHRDDPRPLVAGRGQLLEIEPPILRSARAASRRRDSPGSSTDNVRRKLVGERHHVVARPPVEPFGDQVDARRRVRHQRDFVAVGADQPRRRVPRRLDLPRPLGPDACRPRRAPARTTSARACGGRRVIGATAAWSK